MPKSKPRRSRKDYFQSRNMNSMSSNPPTIGQTYEERYVNPQMYVPSQMYPIPNIAQPIPNVGVNNVTMTLQEYHALMRHSRTQQLRCIYFPDCCQRIQPMNAWCAFCISQYMFPGINQGVYTGMSPCTPPLTVCNVPSVCPLSYSNTCCPTYMSRCPLPPTHHTHQNSSTPNDTCPFPEKK